MAKKRQQFTFEDVKKASQEKGVELLSEEIDQNKRVYANEKFLIKAKICLHEKTINLCQLKRGICLNFCKPCVLQQKIIKYNEVFELFQKRGCALLVTKEEYNEKNLNGSNSLLKFIGNCGHECQATYLSLLRMPNDNKKNCIKCTKKNKYLNNYEIILEKNLQQMQKICAEKNLQYIKTLQQRKKHCIQHLLKCQYNHLFERTISDLKNQHFCDVCCFNKEQSSQQQTVSTGDYHEQCVFKMIENFCKTIQIVGNTGNLYDIIYTLDDNIERGIQVKSLSKRKYEDNVFNSAICSSKNKIQQYPDNTIIVLINQQYQRFVVDMSQNFSPKGAIVHFNSNKCKFKNTKFTDQNLFVQRLVSLLSQASEIDRSRLYSSNIQKEIYCFERLQKKCTELGFSFQRNTTNGSSVDVYINNKPVQVKYCEQDQKYNSIAFSLGKNGGWKNGKPTRIPYSQDDEVQYFIFEYGGENKIFSSQFCVLSKQFLIQKKYIANSNSKGKTHICIWKPNGKSDRDTIGTSNFWNKFDQLQ